jgi:dipeptidase E
MFRKLLLISSSSLYGTGYLDHAESEIRDHLRGARRVLFVPYALRDCDDYHAKVHARLEKMGFDSDSIHQYDDPNEALAVAEAIFVGGGNTFRLLKTLYEKNLLQTIRDRVDQGALYIGSSAGTNVACPTIRTTNDMPVVEPPSLAAIGLLPFQINPHYLDPDPNSTHMGETREERIREYLDENDLPVVGLREGTMIRAEEGKYVLKGITSARIFRKGQEAIEVNPETSLNSILSVPSW